MSDIQGNPAAILKIEYGYDRQSGPYVQKTWRGTQAAIVGIAATVGDADSYIYGQSGDGATWQISARYGRNTEEGGTETPVGEERLRFNQIQKSIFDVPVFASVRESTKRYIQAYADNADDDGELRNQIEIDPLDGDDALALWDLVSAGVKEQIVYQPVVIVTDTASASYAWNIGFDNYGRILSTAAMISDADLESGWVSNLPSDTSPDPAYVYGWLKSPPEIVSAGGNRSQLVQEFIYGLWAKALYGDLIT
jgi:hypothetical protein